MAEYRAKPGQEDRHGEMTGAISFNMMFCALPVTVWGIFVGPWLLDSTVAVAVIAVVMAVVLPILFMPLSRWVWSHLSEFMETH